MRDVSGELVVKIDRMSCPYCKRCRTNLNGTRKGKQIYWCRDCGKQWREGGAVGGHSFPPDQIGAAIQAYYTLLSLRKAARVLEDQFGIQDADVTPETIRKWVDRYTDAAIRLVRDLKTPTWESWWDFFIYSPDNEGCRWISLDDRTDYIYERIVFSYKELDLAMGKGIETRASATYRHKMAVFHVVKQPDWEAATGGGPIFPSYGGIKWLFYVSGQGAEPKSRFPTGWTPPKSFHEFRATCARFERSGDTVKVRRRLAGWVITRNWFTTQTELGGHTPGEAAGIKSPIASWADVVRLEARAFLPTVDPKAPVATRLPSKEPASEGDCGSQG